MASRQSGRSDSFDDDFELSPVTPITLQKFFANSEREVSGAARGGQIPRQASNSSSITYRERQTKYHRRVLWSALIPGFFALLVTLGLASTLVAWLFATKITVSSRCAPEIHNQSPSCPGDNDQVLFTTVPVNIILTVSKIVDSAQSACAGVIMLLAAFRLSQSWQSNKQSGSISIPEFSELVALCTSGRLWALCNALSISWRRRKGHNSRLLLRAIGISLFAQLLSHTISFVDIYLHEATTTSITSAGTRQAISTSMLYGRSVNTSCSTPLMVGRTTIISPCSVGTGINGQYLRYPNQAYAVYANVSSTDRVAKTLDQSVGNLAITMDARLLGTENFNATTVGISGQCRVATKECKLQSIPHGTSGYNCSAVGLVNADTASGYSLGRTGYHNLAVDVYKSPNSTNLTAGMPDDSVVQQRFLIPIQVPSVGSNPDSGFASYGDIGQSALVPEIMLWCSIVAHSVSYQYSSGEVTVMNHTYLDKNASDVLLYPIIPAQVADTISQTNSDALSGNSTEYANAFARQLAADSLAYGSGSTLTSMPLQSEGYTLGTQLTTSIPLRALLPFVVLVYVYGLYISILLISAMTCSSDALNKAPTTDNHPRAKREPHSPDDLANIVRLGQLRLTNPAFIIHQLLGTSTERSMETFDSNLWNQEEKSENVKFTSEYQGSENKRGVGLHV
ncbi:protein of unknown function [Taphrina deformans PYCC 5710]|uniref:Uncharacterized protein n=1 Tax=Taphrina deformans (strain PYCC 5710 / ATCC 11124 / CBS 356.35 / IMI 108563 / JCM 9778 / NBRC 8474) TaxID=1097556 RepID=R4XEU9_TAPDE|nr:protein of unknown function [Taphrina deformans PYCC 5710]|eukprot:CCG84311.1 protein of unknown function [Taphrina deformans PYCC 5710]